MSFFENTRKPEGLGGKLMVAMMNVGHSAVFQGSVEHMNFTDASFDVVTAFETVYFWPGLPKCFQEVYRVLKPGGIFLICNESNGDTDKDEK